MSGQQGDDGGGDGFAGVGVEEDRTLMDEAIRGNTSRVFFGDANRTGLPLDT